MNVWLGTVMLLKASVIIFFSQFAFKHLKQGYVVPIYLLFNSRNSHYSHCKTSKVKYENYLPLFSFFTLLSWLSYFSCCCDKILQKRQFKEERFIFPHCSSHHSGKSQRWVLEAAGHMASVVKKQSGECFCCVHCLPSFSPGSVKWSFPHLGWALLPQHTKSRKSLPCFLRG